MGQELRATGFLANPELPVLHTHYRFGHRIERVNCHPALESEAARVLSIPVKARG